jgi:hypothetical protein
VFTLFLTIFRVGNFMKTLRLAVVLASTISPLLLTACGEGYEAVPYHGVPYTEERTAGAGVTYVRAMLQPAKGPILPEPMILAPQKEMVIEDASPLFSGKQIKK